MSRHYVTQFGAYWSLDRAQWCRLLLEGARTGAHEVIGRELRGRPRGGALCLLDWVEDDYRDRLWPEVHRTVADAYRPRPSDVFPVVTTSTIANMLLQGQRSRTATRRLGKELERMASRGLLRKWPHVTGGTGWTPSPWVWSPAAIESGCRSCEFHPLGTCSRGTRPPLGCLPPNFPRQIRADGRAWLFTGKVGTHHATVQASAEYGTDAIRYWRRADGTIEKD